MARKNKKSGGGGGGGDGWIVTFSDLMTLLLTFFVLLLSMSTIDTAVLKQISSRFSSPFSIMNLRGQGRLPERIKLLTKLLLNPADIAVNHERIKDLLFPEELLPKELNYGNVQENLRILEHPEGVVIVLTDSLLFAEGSAELDGKGRALMEILVPVIQAVNADVNISGYTDNTVKTGVSNDDISARRALSALEVFLKNKLDPGRFSISGYGMDRPLYPNSTPDGRAKNRRIEILLKTTNRFAGYR